MRSQHSTLITASSSAIRRGLALLEQTGHNNNHLRQRCEVVWTFVGYGTKWTHAETPSDHRPLTQPVRPDSIPEDLKERSQWVCWDWSWRNDAYWGKPPISAVTKGGAFENDPRTWTTFDDAWTFASIHNLPGIGYVFSQDDPFAGIDIDSCRDPDTSEIDIDGLKIISSLRSYTEISPTGKGIHILVRGKLEDDFDRRTKALPERFDREHYLTITGQHLNGTPKTIQCRSNELRGLPLETPNRNYGSLSTNRDEPSIRRLISLDSMLIIWLWDGYVQAMDYETGVLRWQIQANVISILETTEENQIFISTDDELLSIELSTGREIWRRELYQDRPYMYVHVGTLFLYDESTASLEALNSSTGESRWSFESEDAQFDIWIDVSIADDLVYVTGYNSDYSDLFAPDDLFHTCILGADLGKPRSRHQSKGDDIATIEELYASLRLPPALMQWSNYNPPWQQGWSQIIADRVLAESESGVGIACYDSETEETLWVFEEADIDFPIICNRDTVFASLRGDASSIVAITANSGNEVWRFMPRLSGWAYPIAASSNTVYILERTHPCLFALAANTGEMLWSLPLDDTLDRCLDPDIRHLNVGEYSRSLHALLQEDHLYVRTGHRLCAIRIPEP